MNPQVLASEIDQLTSFPDIAFRISDLLDDESSSAWDIGALIEQDPALSVALLRIANSALYNSGVPVNAIDRAVTVVGAREARDLAFGICTTNAFHEIQNEIISFQDFWRHSLFCAAASRVLADALKLRSRDSLFMAGLLHDIEHLVMYSQRPELSLDAKAKARADAGGQDIVAAERSVFGFDHTEVGATLMQLWGLPEYLQAVARGHHRPDNETPNLTVDIVHVANSIATLAERESEDITHPLDAEPAVIERLGLQDDSIAHVTSASHEIVTDLMQIFSA